MKKRLVLAGGGHAHMTILASIGSLIKQGIRVTVIQPAKHHYYSGMGPGMLGGVYTPQGIRFQTQKLVEQSGGEFILDRVTDINAPQKQVTLSNGEKINYDVLSCNTGSQIKSVPGIAADQKIHTVKPIADLKAARRDLIQLSKARKGRVAVVGGGAAALEIAGNAWRACKESGRFIPQITIFAGRKFMRHQPRKIQEIAAASFAKRGIEIAEGSYVSEIKSNNIHLDNGQKHQTDMIFLASGVTPGSLFKRSGLKTGSDGGLLVNEYLQHVTWPDIFGGGDCIFFEPQPLDKVGVYAVRQNPILLANVTARLEGKDLTPFNPGKSYLLIFNLGDGTGIMHKSPIIFSGRLAFMLKSYIDKKFMKHFQAFELKS